MILHISSNIKMSRSEYQKKETMKLTIIRTMITMMAVSLATRTETVHGFSVTTKQLRQHTPSPTTPLLRQQSTAVFPTANGNKRTASTTISSSISLHAAGLLGTCATIPLTWTTLGLVLFHVILGAAPVPFVVNSTKKGGWYRKIALPSWTPPDVVFAPVWTTLYSCMGIAVSIISGSATIGLETKKRILWSWAVHFLLNISWAPTFFGRQQFRAGYIIQILMVLTLAVTVIPPFYAVDPVAGCLLLPYMAWITFATFLNRTICAMNPTVKGYNDGMLQAQIQKLQGDAAKYAGL
jgi:tryptophan-rich sensory protein